MIWVLVRRVFSVDLAKLQLQNVRRQVVSGTTAFTQLFSGTVKWVQIDIGAAAKDADHRIGAEERFNLAMARQ